MPTVIPVDLVRKTIGFFGSTAGEGGWRVCIIDSADELNVGGANAILKTLEEPPAKSLLIMISHAPGRLLPTIRSRCRRLALQPLADEVVISLLGDHAPNTAPDERTALARLAEGSIGRALELASAGSLALYREMVEVLSTLPDLDMPRLHGFAERFARRGEEANAAWRSLNYLFDGWLKGLARQAAVGQEAAKHRLLAVEIDGIGAGPQAGDVLPRLHPAIKARRRQQFLVQAAFGGNHGRAACTNRAVA